MILLENKIAIFNKIVFLKEKEECEKKLQAEKEKIEKILADKEKSLKKESENYVNRRIELANRRGYELVARANEEKRILGLREDEKLLNQLLETLSKKLKEFTETKEYIELETKFFEEIVDEIEDKEIYLYVRENEKRELIDNLKRIAEKNNITLHRGELFDYHIGGFIISDMDRSYNIDLSLRNKVEDMRYKIGSMLHEKLKETGDIIANS
ncbi:hypothetical protein KQI68_02755 [Peptoniphilus sp. MSJ-1]|uniref:V-type ATP synthase subunit E n=1 Tax=Peptoniphilus ovalis TaxID=2841503 RepID=A0ABS6FF22_9FIRM|nr:hypothetical protein [Peptoniphilus ovalis]MBU5668755.1 hypothetical protein [Peptoniphilus ovalis]